jgi:hypothetical protein
VPAKKPQYASGTWTAQLRTVAFQFSDESAKFAAAPKNYETKDVTKGSIDTKLMGQFG